MLFYSFFKSLVGKEVTVELKNDLGITGQLHSVDQYLNIKLNDIYVTEQGTDAVFLEGSKLLYKMCSLNDFLPTTSFISF